MTTSPAKVLVVEDEAKMARLVGRALSAAGFQVRTAAGGVGALERLRQDEYALVILDLLLPDLDGFSVLAAVVDLRSDQRVMVLSALNDVSAKVLCLERGACDYVTKPFELPELIARVRLRAREGGGRRAEPVRYLRRGRYALDLKRRLLTDGDDEVIALTTREFLLLEYLMGHEGDTCTREELLENVWGYSFDPGTNVVDVCIGRLRHKLGVGSVTTVRNVGYCFVGT